MSAEASTKPVVEEPVVAAPKPTEAPVDTVAPITETKETETPAPVGETAEPTTEDVAPVKEAAAPVEEGILGYKGPGLLKGFIFQKKHFWFGSEPVEQKNLASYLRGEKPEAANHNVAWASHTGKGLLFFSKKAIEKITPAHIFNLSEVTDITEDGPTEFYFTQGGHKHTFQASSLAERDNWVSTLKTKVEESKTLGETVKDTEEYKTAHSSLTKPTFVAASSSAPKKSTEVKDKLEAAKEEKKEEHEAKKEEKAEKAEEKKEIKEEKKERTKSRSASRKRTSIFGSIPGFGKKEEKTEAKADKKEETPVVASETPATASSTEPVPAPVEVAPIASEPSAAPVAATSEPAIAAEPRPAPSKRNSIFDSLKSFGQKKPTEEKKVEEAPIAPVKETEPVSQTAPVIPAVESTEPLSTSVGSPATAPTTETTATASDSKPVEAPVVKSDKRKSSLPWLSKKKEVTSSDEEGDKKPTSPFAKLRATVKGKSSPKAEKAAEKEKTPEPAETAAPVAKKEETPVVATEETKKDGPVAATPQVAATA